MSFNSLIDRCLLNNPFPSYDLFSSSNFFTFTHHEIHEKTGNDLEYFLSFYFFREWNCLFGELPSQFYFIRSGGGVAINNIHGMLLFIYSLVKCIKNTCEKNMYAHLTQEEDRTRGDVGMCVNAYKAIIMNMPFTS